MIHERQKKYIILIVITALISIQCDNQFIEKIAEDASTIFSLTITSQGNGITDPSDTIKVTKDTEVSISAIPASGYQFSEWNIVSGTGISFGQTSLASTTVKLKTGDAAIKAVFVGARDINVRDQSNNQDIPSGGILDFGDGVVVGSPKEILCRIENLGQSMLTLAGLPIIGPLGNQHDCEKFSFNILPAMAVAPGSYTSFSVIFNPVEFKEYKALLVIYTDDIDEGTYTVELNGSGTDTPVPDMNIRVGSEAIPSTVPKYEYQIPNTLIGNDKAVTFVLENKGTETLNLFASPNLVNLTGTDSSLFSVTTFPTSAIIPGLSTSFVINFSPTQIAGAGIKMATVSIPNNDPDENPYEFVISSEAITPEINVRQETEDVLIGESYNFRYRPINQVYNISFTIQNTGTAPLEMTSQVQKSGSTCFNIESQPATSIAAGGSSNFTVSFTPSDYPEESASISIYSSDLDESTYTFNIIGKGSRELTPSINTIYDNTTSMESDTLVVGSSHEDLTDYNIAGAAYIFYRNQNGTDVWGQVKRITAYDAEYNEQFGSSTSISGDYLIVGACGDNYGSAVSAGSVYVYYRNQGGADNWGFKKHILTPVEANYIFGYSVSVEGSTLAAGAPNGNRVYLFYCNEGGTDNWGLKKELIGSGQFGGSLDLEGDLLIIGSWHDNILGTDSGSARLYSRNLGGSDNWGSMKTLTGSDEAEGSNFGSAVAMDGDYIIVGASGEDAAYVFARDQGGAENWGETVKLTHSIAAGTDFGSSVAIIDHGTTATAIVGAADNDYAYIFNYNGSVWSEAGIVDLGRGVSMNGDSAVLCGTYRAHVIKY